MFVQKALWYQRLNKTLVFMENEIKFDNNGAYLSSRGS
jgi:hypothetical protein